MRAARDISIPVLRFKLGWCRYEAAFKYSAIAVPIIMLAVLWVFGVVLLVTQQCRLRAEQRLVVPEELSVKDDHEGTVTRYGHASPASLMRGSYEAVNARQFVWVFYLCFVAG